jgi:hypothetical protein
MHQKRSAIKRDLRSPKYRPRIIPNKRKQANRLACRNHGASNGKTIA